MPESETLGLGRKTVKKMAILAHGMMGQQAQFFADAGQIVKSAHGDVDVVTDAVHIQQQLGRIFFQQNAGQTTDHGVSCRKKME